MRVLLIEPDHATAQSIELILKSEGFNVYTTDLGEEGVDLGKIYDYDLILLELALSDINGLEVLRRLRASKITTPVMILATISDVATKVKALRGGADDYMTKPFHKDELIARCHAIVRRSKGHAYAIITVGNISLNLDAKTVKVEDRKVPLTAKEYMMLELLFLRKGSTITKEMFMNHLYGGMDEPELKLIDVFICKLRKKLAVANDGHHHIETVWGRGFVARCSIEATLPNTAPAVWGGTRVDSPIETTGDEIRAEVMPRFDPVIVPGTMQPIITTRSVSSLRSPVLAAITNGKSRFKDILYDIQVNMPGVTEKQIRYCIGQLIREKFLEKSGKGTGTHYSLTDKQEAAA